MPDDIAVSVEHVGKRFRIPHERYNSLKQTVLHFWSSRRFDEFEAIQDVDFQIKRGEFFGVIGQNGSGKSTMLKILAGIYTPTKGKIRINGRLSPFIELGVGFNPQLTARENVYLNGAILGMAREEINAKFDEIIEFAELEQFVDQKIKNFSSGMLVRLAFSVAIRAQAEILLIDEVLAVGDSNFQQKCYDVFRQLKQEGRTIIFVSHDLPSIREFSDRVLLLNKGVSYGIFAPDTAIKEYANLNLESMDHALEKTGRVEEHTDQSRPHIAAVRLLNGKGKPARGFNTGDTMTVELDLVNPKQIPLDAGVSIMRSDGFYCFGVNTFDDSVKLSNSAKQTLRISYPQLPLLRGSYYLIVGVFKHGLKVTYDMQEHIMNFQVGQTKNYGGIAFIEHNWSRDD